MNRNGDRRNSQGRTHRHLQLTPGIPKDAGSTPNGRANWIEFTDGIFSTADGKTIAIILPGGGDYTTRHVNDNVLEIDLQVVACDPSGRLFRFRSSGYDYLTKEFMDVMDGNPPPANPPPEAPDLYGFEVIQVNTSSKENWWLNFAVLVGHVRLVLGEKGVTSVDYRLFKVTK